jgi:flavin-dependent thymidylate synthase
MQVKLINYTGMGMPDPADFAAKLLIYTKDTRLEQSPEAFEKIQSLSSEEVREKLDYIANTIRSSWEFVDYTFQINGVTRAFTHQFVRTRTGSYAQESQRTVSKENGFTAEMPKSFKGYSDKIAIWNDQMMMARSTYRHLIEAGAAPQDARGVLPTNIHTNIIAKFNLRTMADMIPKRENVRAQGEYMEVARLMGEEMLRVHPWVEPFLWPDRNATPNLDEIMKELVGEVCPAHLPKVNAALKEIDKLKKTWG